jgi:hypothetical protein
MGGRYNSAAILGGALKQNLFPPYEVPWPPPDNAFNHRYRGACVWTFKKPSTPAWDNYVYCKYLGGPSDLQWRIPNQGGNGMEYTYVYRKSNSWSYVLRGYDPPTETDTSGNTDLGYAAAYVLVHKDDRKAALASKVCDLNAPDD